MVACALIYKCHTLKGAVLATCYWYLVPVVGLISMGTIEKGLWGGLSTSLTFLVVQVTGCLIIWVGLTITFIPGLKEVIQDKKTQTQNRAQSHSSMSENEVDHSFLPFDEKEMPLLGSSK